MLTGQSLATFSLVDCTQSLLGETLEVLAPYQLARLWQQLQQKPMAGSSGGSSTGSGSDIITAEAFNPGPAGGALKDMNERSAVRLARLVPTNCCFLMRFCYTDLSDVWSCLFC